MLLELRIKDRFDLDMTLGMQTGIFLNLNTKSLIVFFLIFIKYEI
jgi:hypothetical protein